MHMSDQDSMREESLPAYQRWEMASFDPVPEPEPEVDDGAFEAELQRLRDTAHTQGVASGHVAGQALGYQAGYEQGRARRGLRRAVRPHAATCSTGTSGAARAARLSAR